MQDARAYYWENNDADDSENKIVMILIEKILIKKILIKCRKCLVFIFEAFQVILGYS